MKFVMLRESYSLDDVTDCLRLASSRGAINDERRQIAIFLHEFIEKKTPWIHLDIAGTAFLDAPRDYHLSKATGSPVRLLVEMLECIE